LLNFFKMSFYLFSTCSIFAAVILMPVNLRNNVDIGDGGDQDGDDTDDWFKLRLSTMDEPIPTTPIPRDRDWLDLISDANSYLTVHFLFTYLFTLLALYFIYKNYKQFIRARQLFSLELVHSIPARTVMVTRLPSQLQGERTLAEYFEGMGLAVESVNICREVDSLKKLLDKRTEALLKLESAWVQYVGNPAVVEASDSSDRDVMPLIDVEVNDVEEQRRKIVVPHRPRPTLRPGWFKAKVDALEYLEAEFKKADEQFMKRRRTAKFKPTHVAFVTFEKMSSAQIAVQTVHATSPFQCRTYLAPEARDIVWSSMSQSITSTRVREIIVLAAMVILLFTWAIPVSALAGLLSYEEIVRTWPRLGELIAANPKIQEIIQNTIPSLALITLNACLPFLLEALTFIQGYPARSWIEYSLLKKYFLFLLTSVVFIFLLASTYWQLIRDLANSPAKVPEKLAAALQIGRARHFFVSYVVLQGVGLMPLQLLNLGVILPKLFFRIFVTRTPRDFAELNAPPMINYGVVYPQAILIFIITLLYSIISPLILIFGAVYFGVGYIVYKYKLLFVFYKPYESQGQAWPITFVRLIWGIIIFLVFMIGMFILKKSYILSSLLVPLLVGTVIWSWYIYKGFRPLSKYVSLSSVSEVQRGEDSADVVRLRMGHPVTWSQSYLNRRRYAQNDETLYVAPEDERTDYSQPPMANWYTGVLNTGKRRYGHPALNGILPQPWLPLKKGQSMSNGAGGATGEAKPAVVLTLRKRYSIARPSATQPRYPTVDQDATHEEEGETSSTNEVVANPWQDSSAGASSSRRPGNHHHRQLSHRLSFDAASGVIMLPEDDDWLEEEESDSDQDYGTPRGPGIDRPLPQEPELHNAWNSSSSSIAAGPSTGGVAVDPSITQSPSKRYTTYYHHPEKRKRT
ncbi:CSC1 family protein, partial [Abortiporus biennis]